MRYRDMQAACLAAGAILSPEERKSESGDGGVAAAGKGSVQPIGPGPLLPDRRHSSLMAKVPEEDLASASSSGQDASVGRTAVQRAAALHMGQLLAAATELEEAHPPRRTCDDNLRAVWGEAKAADGPIPRAVSLPSRAVLPYIPKGEDTLLRPGEEEVSAEVRIKVRHGRLVLRELSLRPAKAPEPGPRLPPLIEAPHLHCAVPGACQQPAAAARVAVDEPHAGDGVVVRRPAA
mmetsp:Transcript_24341/g.58030  ORF Transcript_24341/g.58030 Transcript_24341/m.58030 type:complete len:235 (+) Transcript_24341:302-1006(+)